jgi:hypothetical protein
MAFCEVLEVRLLSATALLLLERLTTAWSSSAFRFEGEVCTEVDLVYTLLLLSPTWPWSFVFDEEALVGVVVDFDLAMASASGGSEAGETGGGTWRKSGRLWARRKQHLRQQLTLRGHGTIEIEEIFCIRQQILRIRTA